MKEYLLPVKHDTTNNNKVHDVKEIKTNYKKQQKNKYSLKKKDFGGVRNSFIN